MRTTHFLLSILILGAFAVQVGAQVPVSPSWASGVAASGWDKLVPSLKSAEAKAKVAAIKGLSDLDFLEKAWGLVLLRDPETAYALKISSIYGVPEDELTDVSDSFNLGSRELYLAIKEEVERRLPAAKDIAAIALMAFSRWLTDLAKDIEFSLDKYPVSPWVNSADQLTTAYFTEYRSVADAAEAERYIACIGKLPAKMAGIVAALDLRTKAGIVLPRGIHEFMLGTAENVANASARNTPFYESFEQKLATSSVPAGAAREALLAKAAAAIERSAIPAWKDLVAALRRQNSAVPANGGAVRKPGGAEYYAVCLGRQTTTNLSAAEIHELGKRELSAIQAQMRELFKKMGYPEGASIRELYARLGRDTGSLSGKALLARIDADIKAMSARLGELVSVMPRLGVEAVWGESGGYYMSPAADGSRPGRYFVSSYDNRPVYDVATTVYHETIPGHHLQIARALEAKLPGFLRGSQSLGFTEGWALYGERLASEMGVYAKDPAGELGRLRMLCLRAARLVMDSGVNAYGWSYGQTVSFFQENTGLEAGFAQSDTTRYFIEPGQATTYYVGYLEIMRLRDKVRADLGATFDLKRFNEAILGNGALPLSVLSGVIDGFIATEKKR